jgi:hypothetical protein
MMIAADNDCRLWVPAGPCVGWRALGLSLEPRNVVADRSQNDERLQSDNRNEKG